MALPKEYVTPELRAIMDKLTQGSEEELGRLLPLTPEDLRVFGGLIQLYCFFDFNLRRAIEFFHHAGLLERKSMKKYPDFYDSEFCDLVASIVSKMDPDQENVSEAMRRLGLVNGGRLYRNLVGHFSARRYPGRDIYVFLSKSDRDARQVFGDTLGKEHAHIGVAVCQDIANLVKDLATHDEWLGLRIPHWHARYMG